MDDEGDLFIAGIVEPHMPLTEHPRYAGSMMRPEERVAYANQVADGTLLQQACIDHAGMTAETASRFVPKDMEIGRVEDAFVDEDKNLWNIIRLPKGHPTTEAVFQQAKDYNALSPEERRQPQGKAVGLSMLRLLKRDPETGVTLDVAPAHTGVTTEPLYGQEHAWGYYLSRGRRGLARALAPHFARTGVHVPEPTRQRWGVCAFVCFLSLLQGGADRSHPCWISSRLP
jgi:hypothetical protein